MPGLLEGKTAVITGAGSGIGREMALLFYKEGAKLVLVDVVDRTLQETVSLIGRPESVHAITVDLRGPKAADDMVATSIKRFGKIDILCNNAGIMDGVMGAAEVSDELWSKVMDINVNAPFRSIRSAIPHMISQGHGVILNTASVAGLFGGRAGVAYTASKHALIGLTKHTASFYGDKGIRCNAMALGAVTTSIGLGSDKPSETGMKVMQKTFPAMPQPANPKDIANVALFLVSDMSASLNGSIVVADKGWTVY
jgi:NAD(P)-dependent dehydrogenase (short-subunit alcohol dehydrogenase family)